MMIVQPFSRTKKVFKKIKVTEIKNGFCLTSIGKLSITIKEGIVFIQLELILTYLLLQKVER
jgi:hypothetical protein